MNTKVPKVGVIITSRYNSKRLPGKALLKIGDKPLLQHVYDRVSSLADTIISATTKDSQPIVDYCKETGIPCFVGDAEEENLIKRMILCADVYELDSVVRIWGDTPFLNTTLIKEALNEFIESKYDYLYPVNLYLGWMFTIYKTNSFKSLYNKMTEDDKYHWNEIDEKDGWLKYGYKIDFHDFGLESIEIEGGNINYLSDLEVANEIWRHDGKQYKGNMSILQIWHRSRDETHWTK